MATKRHTYLAGIALALESLGASLRPRRALAITGIELVNQWYYNPAYLPSCRIAPTVVVAVSRLAKTKNAGGAVLQPTLTARDRPFVVGAADVRLSVPRRYLRSRATLSSIDVYSAWMGGGCVQ